MPSEKPEKKKNNYSAKKKAEIANEVFFYIMAVLVIGLLLFFGVKWIGGMVEKWEMARTVKFKVDLEDAVKKQRAKPYSSFETYTFDVPGKIRKVCFVDKDNFKPFSGLCYEGPPPDPDYNRAFCVLWQSDDPRNVLIEPMSSINTPIELGKIRVQSDPVDQGYICFDTTKEPLKVKLVSLGDATQIARP